MISKKSIERLKELGAKTIMVQAPEGLKPRFKDIASFLEKEGFAPIISVEPCFGGCDLRDHEAKILGCEALLHIGHTDFGVKPEIPVVYEPYRVEYNPLPLLERELDKLRNYRKISVVSTSQFLGSIGPAKEFLEKHGKEVFVGSHRRAGTAGQVLGCDYTAALPFDKEIDCHLYIGTGKFHPLGLAFRTGKPVLSLDIEMDTLIDYTKEAEKLRKIKAAQIEKAKEFGIFGIYVSTKPGQNYINLAKRAKEKLEGMGKTAVIIAADMLTPEKIMGMKIDCLVNCACPRIWEDYSLFRKIVLNPEDIGKLAETESPPIVQ